MFTFAIYFASTNCLYQLSEDASNRHASVKKDLFRDKKMMETHVETRINSIEVLNIFEVHLKKTLYYFDLAVLIRYLCLQ